MTTLDELARRNVPTFKPRQNGDQPVPPADPLTDLLRQQQADVVVQARMAQVTRQQRLAEMAAEAEALKIENDLEAERERQREIRAERVAARMGKGQQGPGGEVLQGLIGMMMEAQRETQERIAGLEAKQAESLRGELGAIRDMVRAAVEKPQPNAVDTVREQIAFFQAIQQLIPKPAEGGGPPPVSNVEEMLRFERMKAEIDMERARFQRDLAKDDAERTQWEREIELKQRRSDAMAAMLGQAFPQLTQAFTERIVGAQDKGSASPAGHPWQCPRCKTVNLSPPGTAHSRCSNCEEIVQLEPIGLPPPREEPQGEGSAPPPPPEEEPPPEQPRSRFGLD